MLHFRIQDQQERNQVGTYKYEIGLITAGCFSLFVFDAVDRYTLASLSLIMMSYTILKLLEKYISHCFWPNSH